MLKSFVLYFCLALAVPALAQPPTTLTAAVESALVQNPDIRRAREQLEEFNQRVRGVRADALPQVDLVGLAQRTRDPGLRNSPFFSRLTSDGPVPPEALSAFYYGSYLYQLEVEQTVFHFGRVGHALEAARQEFDGVQADVQTVENEVALNVAYAYFDLQLAQARQRVLEAEQEARERQLQQVRDQLELGEATRLDVLQAEVALANLRPEVIAANNTIRVALTRVNETLGRAPLEPFVPAAVPETVLSLDDVPDGEALVRLAVERRPELRRFSLNRRVLQEAEQVTRSDKLPEITARASIGINTFKLDNLIQPELHGWNVGVNVRWSLFDGQRTSATIGQFRSQRRQSELAEEAFRARLARDLERASGDLRQALEIVDVAELAITQASEARRVAEDLFGLGAATFLNVLDAERALRQAEMVRLQGLHRALSALAEVKTLAGLRPDAPDTMLARASRGDDQQVGRLSARTEQQ